MKALNPFRKALLLVVPVSFVLGLTWGVSIYKKHRGQSQEFSKSISILTIKEVFNEDFFRAFAERHKTAVKVTEVDTAEELLEKARESATQFDLIGSFSFQAPAEVHERMAVTINLSNLPNASAVSADFLRFSNSGHFKDFTVPLIWGANGLACDNQKVPGAQSFSQVISDSKKLRLLVPNFPFAVRPLARILFARRAQKHQTEDPDQIRTVFEELARMISVDENWLLPSAKNIVGCALANHVMLTLQQENPNLKFVVPEEKASIWTFGFYIPRSTAHRREADAALDFMFEANSSQKLADKKRFALTNTKAENLPIAPELKPSFLKTFDLNQLEIAHDESVMNQLLAGFLKRRLQDQAHP